jgi:hypothetical protein
VISNLNRNTVIVMTLCNRPAYTQRVLDALSRCEDIDRFPVAMLVEPINQHVIDLAVAFTFLPHVKAWVNIGQKQVGCNVNTYSALAHGFDHHTRVIALEDDTVPGRDFLQFCDWGLSKYQNDKAVFSVCGYQRGLLEETGYRNAVIREQWFTPWGWATWKDRWDSMRDSWPADDKQISWDTVIDKLTRRDRYEVRPLLARIQNIGAEGGAHVPGAAWHAEHHLNRHWIESVPGPRVDEWREVPSTMTKALRAHHPC